MAVTGFFHHMGTFLLLAATALLIVPDISAPVINHLGLLKVDLNKANEPGALTPAGKVSFGNWGYCLLDTNSGHDACTKSHVGYWPTDVMSQIENTSFSHDDRRATHTLSKVMILHPIATGIVFVAFLLGAGAGFFGSLLAAAAALLGFVATLVVMACDFALFAIVRRGVNRDGSGAHAHFAEAIWCVLASAVCSLLGTLVLLLTCCSARLHRGRRARDPKEIDGYAPPARRRRWF